jgi:PAS domain S-box-containing protein
MKKSGKTDFSDNNVEFSYKRFFENAVEGLFQSTFNGQFLNVNPALAGMLGYESPEDLISSLRDLKTQLYAHPEDRDRLLVLLRKEGKANMEVQFRCKDGSIKWISLVAREIRDKGTSYIEGLNIDITDRKKTEMALKDSEERFRRTFDQAPIGAAIVGLDLSFLRVNKVLCDLTGYSEAELLTKKTMDIIHPDDQSIGREYARRLMAGEIDNYENDRRFIHKNKDVLWVTISMRLLRDQNGKPLYLLPMYQDITSRKNALDVLAATQKRLEYLMSANPAVIYSFSMDKGYPMTFVSKNVKDITGYEADEFMRDPGLWERRIHPDDLARRDKTISTIYAEKSLVMRYRFQHKDDRYIWLQAHVRLSTEGGEHQEEIVGFISDVTDQQVINDRLQRTEFRYKAIVEDQVEQVCRYKSDGRVTFVNDAYAGFFQKKKEELVGTKFTPIVHEEDRQTVENLLRGLTQSKPVAYMEYRVILPDGQIRWLHRSVRGFFDSSGRPTEYQVVGRDVTEKVVAEHEIQRISNEKEQYRLNLEAVFSSIPDAVLTVDQDMRIIHINRAMAEFCCISDKLVPGSTLMDIAGSCERSCFQVLFKTLQTKESVIEYRLECATSNPRKIFIINSSPLRDHEHRFMGAVLVIRDITRLANLEKQISGPGGYKNIIGKSAGMQEIYRILDLLADVETTVLITGESGTGKELIAEALHYGGSRAKGPLVKVNCAALADNLLESELFGHVRGAFTGAVKDKVGRFEAAEGGTLFLDEIGDIPLSTQLKLLRALERKEYERVGDSRTLKADVRVITATNVDLQKKIRQGLFREDLYYRLKVMAIHLPPLRERPEDVPVLIQHFIHQLNLEHGKNIVKVSDEVMKLFMEYQWPGNIRELRHTLEHAFILCPSGEICMEHLPREMSRTQPEHKGDKIQHKTKVDLDSIHDALNKTGGNKARAARDLGIDRRTLYRNLEKK